MIRFMLFKTLDFIKQNPWDSEPPFLFQTQLVLVLSILEPVDPFSIGFRADLPGAKLGMLENDWKVTSVVGLIKVWD